MAVLLAVEDPPKPPKLSPGQQITDRVLDSIILGYDSVAEGRSRPWYFEGREPGAVLAGYQHGELYMRVRVAYDAQQVSFDIIESRNFRQTETRIHSGALARLQALEVRIRRQLGRLAL